MWVSRIQDQSKTMGWDVCAPGRYGGYSCTQLVVQGGMQAKEGPALLDGVRHIGLGGGHCV